MGIPFSFTGLFANHKHPKLAWSHKAYHALHPNTWHEICPINNFLSRSCAQIKISDSVMPAEKWEKLPVLLKSRSFPYAFRDNIFWLELSKLHLALLLPAMCMTDFTAGFHRDDWLYLDIRERVPWSQEVCEGRQHMASLVTCRGCICQFWWKETMTSLFVFRNFTDLSTESQSGNQITFVFSRLQSE